jgi:hypothetical protein
MIPGHNEAIVRQSDALKKPILKAVQELRRGPCPSCLRAFATGERSRCKEGKDPLQPEFCDFDSFFQVCLSCLIESFVELSFYSPPGGLVLASLVCIYPKRATSSQVFCFRGG